MTSSPEGEKYGLRWFLPIFRRDRTVFGHVLVASFAIQLLALATPILFQVIIDKVLVHSSEATLILAVVGLVIVGLFEVILLQLRAYGLAFAKSRFDVDLGRRVFRHLMSLPLSHFDTTAIGQTTARVREADRIGEFFCGHGATAVMDLIVTLVCIAVLLVYSASLTLIVLAVIPAYAGVVVLGHSRLRRRNHARFQADATCEQLLVESIVGSQTIKAAAIEEYQQSDWERKRIVAAQTWLRARILGSFMANMIMYIGRLATALILFFGASLVIARELSIGELVAFHMIAGLAINPILRLSRVWQEWQHFRESIARLGDIISTPSEEELPHTIPSEPIRGSIGLADVTFRYHADGPAVLEGVSIEIRESQVVGIVGASGSGKSTIVKLVQGHYEVHAGLVTIDGMDVRAIPKGWLRQQMGVVLQESILFQRTIHENIALGSPFLPRDKVIEVAKLAHAHDFISALPDGYDTILSERGADLSGGQRQRIAIARSLANNPRILILDEALSAVDRETERLIRNNLREIVRDRTVIIISHRLETLESCDRVYRIVNGKVEEMDSYGELMVRKAGA